MDKYQDRFEAGKILAETLHHYANNKNVIVLALPRGGVPVAYEIAKTLKAPLDVFIVRKLGVPTHEELAFGAIAEGGAIVFNQDIVTELHLSKKLMDDVILKEQQELKRRNLKYRGEKSFPALNNKIVILVDDGVATGATMRAAIAALRKFNPEKIVVAVPVAAESTCDEIAKLADEIICPLKPFEFYAVGAWYDQFDQTEDEEVYSLLRKDYRP
jgi:putative phosphoribosyl transferase